MPSSADTQIEARIAARLKDFDRHQLTVVSDHPGARVFRVHNPADGDTDSFTVAFLDDSICLLGDYVPGHHGAVSSSGYGIGWFAGRQGWRYLAEKFLPQGWHVDNVRWWLADLIEDLVESDDANAEQLDELREMLWEDDIELFEDAWRFHSRIDDILPDHEWNDSSPDDYDPNHLVALAVCQRVFARLWHARAAT